MKKQILGCLLVAFCFLFPMITFVQAVSVVESDSVTAFFGSYENSEEKIASPSATQEIGSHQLNTNGEKIIPVTGATNLYKMQFLGILCFLMGVFIGGYRMRKKLILQMAVLLFSLGVEQVVVHASETTSTGLITFEADTSITNPVDPLNPEKQVIPIDSASSSAPTPGTSGPLSIDFVSNFQFGKQKITSETKTYYAQLQEFEGSDSGPNYVQVTDKRGTQTGWTLSVTQNSQFQTADNEILEGAVLSITSGNLISVTDMAYAPIAVESHTIVPESEEILVHALPGKGMGTWVYRFGSTVEEATTAVKLEVPGGSVKLAKAYTITLTWNLKTVPVNE